jgi:hypothetical protein
MVKTNRRVHLACSRCGWHSLWLAAEQLDFLTSVGPAHPRVFWAPYPLLPEQQLAFIEAEEWICSADCLVKEIGKQEGRGKEGREEGEKVE